jgi:hypothetical protein
VYVADQQAASGCAGLVLLLVIAGCVFGGGSSSHKSATNGAETAVVADPELMGDDPSKAGGEPTDAKAVQGLKKAGHCLSGWDNTFPALKESVKASLRNPSSFEHVQTVFSPVDEHNTFGLIMTYRAQNGFGGMNVEAVGVEVNATTCKYHRASVASLAKRLDG